MPAARADPAGLTAAGPPVDQRLVNEAAHWLARLHTSDFAEKDRAALERWRNQSAEHQRVWRSAEQLSHRLGAIPPALGMAVLDRPRAAIHRRALLKTMVVLLVAPPAGWFAYRTWPGPGWRAEYRTATGERRHFTLADGSRIDLNTFSAVDVEFDATQRLIRQHAGEVRVQTSTDLEFPDRPFIVQTPEGRMRALGTRFLVRTDKGRTRLTVLNGAVEVSPRQVGAKTIVRAGQQVDFTETSVSQVAHATAMADAWLQGVLYVEDMRLIDFTAELARYRSGVLRCDPAVANVRVTGAFQLDDTGRVLELLAQTLPVRIDSRTRYWITIAAR